jgi:8-oxo-dGTP pyrophosphatase MutT (NUDIX family)
LKRKPPKVSERAGPLAERLRAALSRQGGSSSDFDLNPEDQRPEGRVLRPAGVLIAVSTAGEVPEVILTKRSSALKHHPGQIAFPGGKQDETDAAVTAAALREAGEEIGLPAELPQIIGCLPEHETVTGFRVTPVVAVLDQPFDVRPEPGEVDEVFRVPLRYLLDSGNYAVQSRLWRGSRRYYYTVPFGPYYIWGATARMLRGLAARMEE